MITEQDLQEAIAECQGQRNPNANTCIKLAAFYTIRNEMFGKPEQLDPLPAYSFADAPESTAETLVDYNSGTEFSDAIRGRKAAEMWAVMDELMSVLQVTHPRLYNGTLNQLRFG